MGSTGKALGVLALAVFFAFGGRAESSMDYVQSGLIAQYDAYDNSGYGAHTATPTVWKDLVGSHDLTPMNGVAFAAAEVQVRLINGVESTGTGIQYLKHDDFHELGDAVIAGACTLEISFNSPWWASADAGLFAHGCRFFSVFSNSGVFYQGLQFRDVGGWAGFNGTISDTSDHTVAFVVDGTTLKVYQDGKYLGERSSGGNDTRTSDALTLGAQNPEDPASTWAKSSDFNFKAVRIYDAVLTPEQIQANYAVDVERFVKGNNESPVELPGITIASDEEQIPSTAVTPGLGYFTDGASGVFTAPECVRGMDGHAYRCLGYSLAEQVEGVWSNEEVHPGELAYSYAPVVGEEKVLRLTWRWEAAEALDSKLISYRSITIVNAAALSAGETDEAELRFGENTTGRDAAIEDELYLAYGGMNYTGDDLTQYDHRALIAKVSVGTTTGTYKLPAGLGVDYRRFRFFLLCKAVDPIELYENQNFLSEWDGIHNAGIGVAHADNPAVWKDLKGSHDLTPAGAGTVTFAAQAVQLRNVENATGADVQRLKTSDYPAIPAAVKAGACTIELRFSALQWGDDSGLFAFGCRFFSHWSKLSNGFYTGLGFRDQNGSPELVVPSITDTSEHTAAFVVKGDKITVYHDGTQIFERTASKWGVRTEPEATYLTIGSQDPDTGEKWSAPADFDFKSIRIYSQSLSAEQVQANYEVDNLRFNGGEAQLCECISLGAIVDVQLDVDWLYDANAGTISRGNWTLTVEPCGESTLAVTGYSQNGLEVLDLKRQIVDADEKVWTVVEIGDQAFGEKGAFDAGYGGAGSVGATADAHILVKLPSTLQRIGTKAFYHATYMEVDEWLPESVVEIGDYAFSTCVTITNALALGFNGQEVQLGRYAFGIDKKMVRDQDLAMNLSSIHLGDGVKVISEGCFRKNLAATEVVLPATLEVIGDQAFDRDQLAWVHPTFPAAVTNIGEYAFYGCHSMSNAIEVGTAGLPVTLGEYVFAESSDEASLMSYPSVVFGRGVTEIPAYACFFNANALTNISFSSSVVSIGSYAFDSEHSVAGMVYDFGAEIAIGRYAFRSIDATVNRPNTYRFHGDSVVEQNIFDNAGGEKICAYLPREAEAWNVAIAGKVRPWADCDQAKYDSYFPKNRKRPLGQLTEGVGCLPEGTWVVLWTPPECASGLTLFFR